MPGRLLMLVGAGVMGGAIAVLSGRFFFFSSRRRHTRSLCDWSSDVCSSDLKMRLALARLLKTYGYDVAPFESGDDFLKAVHSDRPDCMLLDLHMPRPTGFDVLARSEERRVGKECRSGWWVYHDKSCERVW